MQIVAAIARSYWYHKCNLQISAAILQDKMKNEYCKLLLLMQDDTKNAYCKLLLQL